MTADGAAVGFDIGGTNVRGMVLASGVRAGDHESVATAASISVRRPHDPDELVDLVVDIVHRLGGADLPVGVGCAGVVDNDGVVRTSPNIASLVHFPLREQLEKRLDRPVPVDNDATTATWAEHVLGAAVGVDDVAFVALGTGIGTGFVLGGRLHRGAHGFAGESGHITVVPDGILCVCGRRGCWERYSSGTALNRYAAEAALAGAIPAVVERAGDPASVTSEHLVAAVHAGDAAALEVLSTVAHWTAVGMANLVNVLDPAMVVIGGGLADIGDPLIDAIRSAFVEVMIDLDRREPVAIARSHFGGRSGAVGAALIAAGVEPDRTPAG